LHDIFRIIEICVVALLASSNIYSRLDDTYICRPRVHTRGTCSRHIYVDKYARGTPTKYKFSLDA